ncbi:MAG: hypothetical protein UU70_C0032G0006 [Candidatus Yanofskybacteria bacterium GW2011_GWA1_41_6]|uniref:Uncharacterized protein n=1 Tax=Candidatus Yanofskybacteria bacterium GW2011_GWA1_41_6 TaxID=1619020 RepID=A0A0G0WL41_9BACT|nr:MAG: hypothetical protein UU70_C0032G0006 [Candidatus Yanofskybacteria bacterium GW2011_GWA1_41_6]
MSAETIGLVSGLLVAVSIVPYSIRTYQGKIQPNLTSWSLWSLLGLALLLTYKSSGAEASLWPAVFGFTNPTLITILLLLRRGEWTKPNRVEKACVVFGLTSLGMWLGVHSSNSHDSVRLDTARWRPPVCLVLLRSRLRIGHLRYHRTHICQLGAPALYVFWLIEYCTPTHSVSVETKRPVGGVGVTPHNRKPRASSGAGLFYLELESVKARPCCVLKPVRTGGLGVHAGVREKSHSRFGLSVR